ncbi:MAG: site-2 protease family protein [Planctomycetes bacterium]|nr:site-2 protease family protein [Planctomycetota bacterium]
MKDLLQSWAPLASFAVFLVVLYLVRRLVHRRRVEVTDQGLVVDRMFSFGWRDIKRLDFWIERRVARYVVHLGASRYSFSHPEATLDDPLKLKYTIIEKAHLVKDPSVKGRVETFLRHGDTSRLPNSLLESVPRPSRHGLVAAALAAVVLWISKAKWMTTVATLIASLGAYRLLHLSWTLALGLLAIVLIHELGHAWVMRLHGLRAGAPVFIPFVGAMIALRDQPRDAMVEAEVGYGGPMAGAIASTAALVVSWLTGSSDWLLAATLGYLLNLFNMIPVIPLDGGRIVAAISPRIWLLGIGGMIATFALTWQIPAMLPVNALFLAFSAISLGNALKAWQDPQHLGPAKYYDVPASYRVAMGCAYFLLAGFLAWMLATCITLVLPIIPRINGH